MGSMSIWHWLIVLVVVLLLFGSGKLTTLMGDLAKGIKVFKKNIAEDEPPPPVQQNSALPKAPLKEDSSVSFHDDKEKATVSSETHR